MRGLDGGIPITEGIVNRRAAAKAAPMFADDCAVLPDHSYRRRAPVTTMSTWRLPHFEQLSRACQSISVVSAP
jgi:hypothetical protein